METKENIQSLCDAFDAITLKEMDGVEFMNRTDTKFVFHQDQLIEILAKAKPFYRVLEVDNIRLAPYESVYFDTDNFEMYQQHQRGKAGRYKVRSRKYCTNNLSFIEIKYKNNKGTTSKKRISNSAFPLFNQNGDVFISKNTPYPGTELKPVISNNFKRITLVDKNFRERITLDTGIQFSADGKSFKLENLAIAEVKRDKSANNSQFVKLLKEFNIKPGGFSKYCFGVYLLHCPEHSQAMKIKYHEIKRLLACGKVSVN
jgi:hypothetical protein